MGLRMIHSISSIASSFPLRGEGMQFVFSDLKFKKLRKETMEKKTAKRDRQMRDNFGKVEKKGRNKERGRKQARELESEGASRS